MNLRWGAAALWLLGMIVPAGAGDEAGGGRIPIRFHLDRPGFVTLVIEDADGVRVRNLISQQHFPAGDQVVWWDGMDDRERDSNAAAHAVFQIPGRMVAPGRYTVRGLTHPGIEAYYLMTPYTQGGRHGGRRMAAAAG